MRQAFWVGKVVGVDVETGQVHLQRWHTGTIDNLNLEKSATPQYRVYQGKGDTRREWIEVTRVLEVINLTKQNRVAKKELRAIDNALKLVAAMQNNSGVRRF